ncbi:cytochrome P450 oxidoreductase protein [Rutstroemia sp. NJR-2017a BBW]|nr:cytochrome P450 oxidoreductase protein [Rutstroemia sp. NJR-2017a BBW]
MLQTILSLPTWVLITLLPTIYILHVLLAAALSPLRHIPGPFLARFTRLWYCLSIYRGSYERENLALHRKYGPIVRIAPNEYSIDSPSACRTIYSTSNSHFLKAPWYKAWMPPDPSKASLFSDLNPHRHGSQRRKFASYYSMSSLVGYERFVDNCTEMLCARFRELSDYERGAVDLQHWLQCYAFDVIGEITFGKRFGFLEMGEDETGGHGYVLGYTMRRIEERVKVLKDPRIAEEKAREGTPDIMTRILMASEKDPEKVTRGDLITMCQSNIGAGSDTTAITLSSVLYHLLKFPETYQKLRKEIDDAEKEGRISDPITFKEAQGLPYLQAAIKEGLRVHPAVGLGLQRVVPSEGANLAGEFIPGGSTVGINAWVAHRNSTVFGADAETWRPERWLEIEEQGRGGEVDKYFLSFGLASRTCIGKNISLLEMSKLIPQLIRRFDFELDKELEKDDGLICENRWFVKQKNFKGRVLRRKDGGKS